MLPFSPSTTDSTPEADFTQIRLEELQNELLPHADFKPWQWIGVGGMGCLMSPFLLLPLLLLAPFLLPLLLFGMIYYYLVKGDRKSRKQEVIREHLYEFSQISLSTSQHCDTALTILRALPYDLSEEAEWMSKTEIKRVLKIVADGQGQVRLSETHRRWLWDRVLSWRFPAIRLTNPAGVDTNLKVYFGALVSCGDRREYTRALKELDHYFRGEIDPGLEGEYRAMMSSWLRRLEGEETQSTLLRAGVAPDANLLRPVFSSPNEEKETLLRSVGEEKTGG